MYEDFPLDTRIGIGDIFLAIIADPCLQDSTSQLDLLQRNRRFRTRRDTATPISRPVFMLTRNFNPNPVIDTRPR